MKSINFSAALLGGSAVHPGVPGAEPRLVDTITAPFWALVNQPLGLTMAFLALVLVIVAVGDTSNRRRDRVVMIVLAALAAISAWIIASGWRWPNHWPRLPI